MRRMESVLSYGWYFGVPWHEEETEKKKKTNKCVFEILTESNKRNKILFISFHQNEGDGK